MIFRTSCFIHWLVILLNFVGSFFDISHLLGLVRNLQEEAHDVLVMLQDRGGRQGYLGVHITKVSKKKH